MRGATIYLIRFLIIVIFLLTRLMRGATVISDSDEFGNKISTHAPHARRDNSMVEKMAAEINFYSRASCEARLNLFPSGTLILQFLLTRLMRGATKSTARRLAASRFLLTRLMRGATEERVDEKYFLSISTHAPHARRDIVYWLAETNLNISTHAPHARRDATGTKNWNYYCISTHAPHARRDRNI